MDTNEGLIIRQMDFIGEQKKTIAVLVETLNFASTALFQISHDGDINPQAVIDHIETTLAEVKE